MYAKASKSEPSSCVILWLWSHHWNKSSAAIALTIFRIPWVSLPLDSSSVFISLNNYEAVSEDLERCLDWELRLIIHRNHLDILPLRSMPRLALLLFLGGGMQMLCLLSDITWWIILYYLEFGLGDNYGSSHWNSIWWAFKCSYRFLDIDYVDILVVSLVWIKLVH